MKWFMKALKQYADFNGRARRKEYWMFVLFYYLFIILTSIIDSTLGLAFAGTGVGIVTTLFMLITLIPALAVGVRRLHDIGKSGWMWLVGLIPLIGSIWLLVLFATNGNTGENKYGANPKMVN